MGIASTRYTQLKTAGYITLVILLTSFRVGETNDVLPGGEKCIIYPGKGLNDIIIHKSLLTEVIQQFGKNKIKKQMVRGCGYAGTGRCGTREFVKYGDKGISFETYPIRKREKKAHTHIVRNISLTKGCNCKTDVGIGVGSTREEVLKAYGEPKDTTVTQNNTNLYMYYDGVSYVLKIKDDDSTRVFWIYIRGT